MKIENRTLLITGAHRGIGRHFVDEALRRGAAKVYAGARRPEACAELEASDARVVGIQLDVTRPEDIRAAAERAGDVELLVNNAGSLASYSVLDTDRAALERDLAVNFFGALDVTKAFVPALERASGAVLNVLTLVSMSAIAGIGGYSASKAAAWSMTQSLRVELGKKGVAVHGVYPGAVDTDMIRSFEMPKTPPADVARAAFDAVERDEPDCFPDPMSQQAGEAWLKNPRALEAMFAKM